MAGMGFLLGFMAGSMLSGEGRGTSPLVAQMEFEQGVRAFLVEARKSFHEGLNDAPLLKALKP